MLALAVFIAVSGNSTTVTPTPYGDLADRGILGLVVVVLAGFAAQAIARERKRGDDAVAEVARLNERLVEKWMPAMVEFNRASNDTLTLLREQLVRERDHRGPE